MSTSNPNNSKQFPLEGVRKKNKKKKKRKKKKKKKNRRIEVLNRLVHPKNS